MKNFSVLFILLVSFLFSKICFAQTDTTKLRLGNSKVWLMLNPKKKELKSNNLVWMGIDIGLCNYNFRFQNQKLQYNFMKTNILRSWRVGLNLVEAKFPFNKKKTANIVFGAGVDWYNFATDKKIVLRETDDLQPLQEGDAVFLDNSAGKTVLASRLQITYFNFPVMFNFRTVRSQTHKKQFNATFGFVPGVRLGSNFRDVVPQDGDRIREIRKDDFLLRRMKIDTEIRLRYYFISVFGRMGFIPLFNKQGPYTTTWSVGVHLQVF